MGLALEDPKLKAQMEAWAAIGGGTFFDAQDGASLLTGIAAALRAPYRVYDSEGAVVATGIVGGPMVAVPTGVDRVEVLTDPVTVYEDIDLDPGELIELRLGETDEP